jgi:hypothetical protein
MVCAGCHDQLNETIDRPAIATLSQLVSLGTIDSMSIQTLLNLFDKIRSGFWFYQHIYLTEEGSKDWLHPIWPFFDRIEKFDRGLIIQKLPDKNSKSLKVFGTNSPVFLESPNCFSIKINDWLFISYSSPFAFSKFLNLPCPNKISLYKSNFGEIEIIPENDLYPGEFSKGSNFFEYSDTKTSIHIISPKQNGLNPKNQRFKQIFSGMASNNPEVFDFIHEPKLIVRDKQGFRRLFSENLDLVKEIDNPKELELKLHIIEVLKKQSDLFSIYDDVETKLQLQNEYINKINLIDFSE